MKKAFALLFAAVFLISAIIPLASVSIDGLSGTGTVLDEDGKTGIAGITVTATAGDDILTAETDEFGKFTFDSLDPAKDYIITFPSDYGVSWCSLEQAADGGYVYEPGKEIIAFLYPVTVTVEGTVYIEGVSDYSGVVVQYQKKGLDGATPGSKTTDENGNFSFGAENGFIYELIFTKGSYTVHGASSNITVGSVCELDLTSNSSSVVPVIILMSLAYGTLTGMVTNDDGASLGEVNVEAISKTDGKMLYTAVTKNGEYEIKDIPIGDYEVKIYRSDIETQTKEITISEGANELDFENVKSRVPTYILGLDFPHTLMFIGILMGIIVIGIILSYRVSLSRKVQAGIDIMQEKKEEDD